MKYELRNGSYYFIQKSKPNPILNPKGERILNMCDQVAIAYDPKECFMWKHGSPDSVNAWAAREREKPWRMGQINIFIFPKGYPVEEINRCVESIGYIGVVYRRIFEKD